MKPTRLLRHVPLLILMGLLASILVLGCSDTPEAPVFDNPFDPDNPASTDPYGLTATANQGLVALTWTHLTGFDIVTYYVERRAGIAGWVEVDSLGAPTSGGVSSIDDDPVPTTVNYYRIVGADANGFETSISNVVPADVLLPPIIRNADNTGTIITAIQDLTVSATSGTDIIIAFDEEFADADTLPRAGEETLFEAFDLQPGYDAEEGEVTVYTRTVEYLGDDMIPIFSETGSKKYSVSFAPVIAQIDGGATIAEPLVDVSISNEAVGVVDMRFASSEEDLETAAWQPGAPIAYGVPVLDSTNPQTLYAQFLSDFGDTTIDALDLQANDLATADFHAILPGNRISETPDVQLAHDAVALQMRTSQYPDFRDAPWVAYADTSVIVLEPIEDQSLYVIYTQFRNHWFESAIRTDWTILSDTGVRVEFNYPLQDMIVRGGTSIEVAGVSSTFDATFPVTGVQTHFGDGWQPATGTDNWEALWDVPLLTEDTVWRIGALATAEDDDDDAIRTGSAWITVTISQFLLDIVVPADADTVTRNTVRPVSGTSRAYLAGSAVDSVAVTILDTRLTDTTDLDSWSVDWTVPDGEGVQLVDIVAVAYAGPDSLVDRIQVTLVPEEEE